VACRALTCPVSAVHTRTNDRVTCMRWSSSPPRPTEHWLRLYSYLLTCICPSVHPCTERLRLVIILSRETGSLCLEAMQDELIRWLWTEHEHQRIEFNRVTPTRPASARTSDFDRVTHNHWAVSYHTMGPLIILHTLSAFCSFIYLKHSCAELQSHSTVPDTRSCFV